MVWGLDSQTMAVPDGCDEPYVPYAVIYLLVVFEFLEMLLEVSIQLYTFFIFKKQREEIERLKKLQLQSKLFMQKVLNEMQQKLDRLQLKITQQPQIQKGQQIISQMEDWNEEWSEKFGDLIKFLTELGDKTKITVRYSLQLQFLFRFFFTGFGTTFLEFFFVDRVSVTIEGMYIIAVVEASLEISSLIIFYLSSLCKLCKDKFEYLHNGTAKKLKLGLFIGTLPYIVLQGIRIGVFFGNHGGPQYMKNTFKVH